MAMARYSPSHRLSQWTAPPSSILLVQKPNDPRTSAAMGTVLQCVITFGP